MHTKTQKCEIPYAFCDNWCKSLCECALTISFLKELHQSGSFTRMIKLSTGSAKHAVLISIIFQPTKVFFPGLLKFLLFLWRLWNCVLFWPRIGKQSTFFSVCLPKKGNKLVWWLWCFFFEDIVNFLNKVHARFLHVYLRRYRYSRGKKRRQRKIAIQVL